MRGPWSCPLGSIRIINAWTWASVHQCECPRVITLMENHKGPLVAHSRGRGDGESTCRNRLGAGTMVPFHLNELTIDE